MKKILVPIDFSNNSHNAYLFARDVAVAIDGNISAVHVYRGSFSEKEPLEIVPIGEKRNELITRLNSFVSKYPDSGEVITKMDVKTEVVMGHVTVEKIAELSEDYDLIIMGTQKEHPVSDRILGSVSSGVAQKAQCPVMLIPEGARFGGFSNLLYASNWESATEEMVDKIIDWANRFQSTVNFVHISPEYEVKGFDKLRQEIMEELMDLRKVNFSFSFSNTEDHSPLRGIQNYADETDADLIVLANRQRGFITNLVGKSLTKEMALNIQIPILVFHYVRDDD